MTRAKTIAWEAPAGYLDADAVRVTERLRAAGHEAYLVGGCVRDLLFGLKPKDFDLVTSAHPNQIRRTFRNCRIIGRRFRLAHVYFRDKILEVATFRAPSEPQSPAEDASEGLLIRDDNVFGTAEQDAVRRDFTFNALFYDTERKEIIDYVDGVEDARKKVVRCIGDPNVRFREDPIRMLRAVRLAARLGCKIEEPGWEAIRRYHPEILNAAAPRILEDLLRMFRGAAMAPAFEMLWNSGILGSILPELRDALTNPESPEPTEELEALLTNLRVADLWTRNGRPVSAPVYLATLLAPVIMNPILEGRDGGKKVDAGVMATDILRPIARRLSISRRDGERIRQILISLGRFVPQKGRRRSPQVFARRSYFADALDLFELYCRSTGDMVETIADWRSRLPATPPDTEKEKKGSAPKRTRRRRPRRRQTAS